MYIKCGSWGILAGVVITLVGDSQSDRTFIDRSSNYRNLVISKFNGQIIMPRSQRILSVVISHNNRQSDRIRGSV